MFMAPTIDEEIVDTIANLKNTSSLGCDGIPLHIIKFCKLELATILLHLINSSMSEGIFPDRLKVAKVIPIFKSTDPKSITNYRLISILTTFSKIFEKIAAVRSDSKNL